MTAPQSPPEVRPDAPPVPPRRRRSGSTSRADLGERMVLNMGPQHPSTHGVLRIVLEVDGERIFKATPDVGYLHRGMEKLCETLGYHRFIPYTDRLDYLAPLSNNCAIALAAEKVCGIAAPPARAGDPRDLLRARAHLQPPPRARRLLDGRRRDDRVPLHVHASARRSTTSSST